MNNHLLGLAAIALVYFMGSLYFSHKAQQRDLEREQDMREHLEAVTKALATQQAHIERLESLVARHTAVKESD